ncbi:tail fiber protein [Thalassospira xiamenensis]|uniref:tail fiber protein n=1 Tax=Thalassospira xiamenensis TaxID=220697 RepID=UPI001FFF023D|nr:phage tail protein [Thalassospira xiamenensis]MCK2166418.1 tail fiber protein [Thalassospira xiamenensis]
MQCNTPVASEVLNVVLAANIAPDRQDDTQLLQAINTLIANGGSGGNGGNGGGSGAEIGSVTAFAMPTPPEGWLVCDGSAVSRTDYADLYAAIGTVWGHGDQIATFNLPDLRGEFVRGFDAGRGVDDGRVFGSGQMDALQNHTHGNSDAGVSGDGGNYGVFAGAGTIAGQGFVNSNYNSAAETRPRNIAMTYAIKAFYPVAASA